VPTSTVGAAVQDRVSVVIATRNRVDELDRTLRRLRALPERPPVFVVDNGSTDGTVQRLRVQHPAVHVIALDHNRGGGARTLGVEVAPTPYVAFADDDSWWAPGSLGRAAEILDAHPRVALLAARILVGPEERLDPTCAQMAASPLQGPVGPGPLILGFVSCGAVVRRSSYLQVGGFEPRFLVGGEEQLLATDLAMAGWELRYVDEVVAHHHPSTVRDSWDRRRRVAHNDVLAAWLRRPLPWALRRTLAVAQRSARDRAALAGLMAAASDLPWALRRRSTVGPELEQALRSLGERMGA
jgi:GT2 family glycosyltransferase